MGFYLSDYGNHHFRKQPHPLQVVEDQSHGHIQYLHF
jgi:hypothetical protein